MFLIDIHPLHRLSPWRRQLHRSRKPKLHVYIWVSRFKWRKGKYLFSCASGKVCYECISLRSFFHFYLGTAMHISASKNVGMDDYSVLLSLVSFYWRLSWTEGKVSSLQFLSIYFLLQVSSTRNLFQIIFIFSAWVLSPPVTKIVRRRRVFAYWRYEFLHHKAI